MPDLNLFFFTITESDFTRIVNLFRKWTERPSNPLRHTDPEKVTLALVNSIKYLLSDRIAEGIGQGGWGHSDKEYMRFLYGTNVADQVHESVMTTVVVTYALHDCLLQLENTGVLINNRSPSALFDNIVDGIDLYLHDRWDARKGHGGVLVAGREGDFTLTPRYRHTAWLFCLYYLLPRFRERMQSTAMNLLEEFNNVKWQNEKVATAVATHHAFSLLADNPLCEALGATVPARVRHFMQVLEGTIESQFSRVLSGWTSEEDLERGRQIYTLFVCTEMFGMYSRPEALLTRQMRSAIEATMGDGWCSADGRGIPLTRNGQKDINASALLACALMRKPHITNREKTFLLNVVSFLVDSLADDQNAIGGTFSWALSYFVRDISHCLTGSGR